MRIVRHILIPVVAVASLCGLVAIKVSGLDREVTLNRANEDAALFDRAMKHCRGQADRATCRKNFIERAKEAIRKGM